jgi:adenosylcobinamide kinase/adenosylcobinamide-phosphate guanylyltransferase
MASKIIFIVGGARSGKSSYALKLAAKSRKPAFVATCQALDKEMVQRIQKHRFERSKDWTTFEEPIKVAALIEKIPARHDLILLDCMTLLVSNLLLKRKTAGEIEQEVLSILKALKKRKGLSIIVSNEVGLGIVPHTKIGREFRDIAGCVNKIIAGKTDSVFFMVSGIPWRIK